MSLSKFQMLFKENNTPIAHTNIAGEYLEVNQAYEQLIGYSLSELKHLTYSDITPAKWHSIEREHVFKEVFLKGEMVYEKEYIHKSGKVIPIKAHVYLIKCDKGLESGMWGTFEEI